MSITGADNEGNYVRVEFNKNHKDLLNGSRDYFNANNYSFIENGIFEYSQNAIWFSLGQCKGVYNYMTFKNLNPNNPDDLFVENGFTIANYDGSFENFSFYESTSHYPEQAIIFYNDSSFILPKLNNGVDRYFTKY